jgi:hypothetical protein
MGFEEPAGEWEGQKHKRPQGLVTSAEILRAIRSVAVDAHRGVVRHGHIYFCQMRVVLQ